MPIISTSVDATSGFVFGFSANSQVLTVESGVVAQAEAASAIDVTYEADSVVNFGDVVSSGSAISIAGMDSTTVVNQASGYIFGYYGIQNIDDVDDETVNNGQIVGELYGIYDGGDSNSIDNYGYIHGNSAAIYCGPLESVYNSGTITGGQTGLSLDSGSNDQGVSITNKGLIRAGTSISSNGSGLVSIVNSGTLDGDVDLSDARGDDIRNTGAIDGVVVFGNGANIFNGVGGTVTGAVQGGSGVDDLIAGNGPETLAGGGGHDKLIAGTGADTFGFASYAKADSDTIVGFNVKNDTIEFDHADFAKLVAGKTPTFSIATKSTAATDFLFYDSATGGLYYDPDGNGAGAAHLVADLGSGLKLTARNFTIV